MFQQKSFFQEVLSIILFLHINNKVYSTANGFGTFQITSMQKIRVIITIEKVLTNREFFLEFRICCLGNIHIPIILFIPGCVIIHSFFQGRSNPHIINNETAFFIPEHPIYPGDGLHQIITPHWLVNIHGSQRRNIKACQPHINHNGNLKWAVIVFEFFRQFILMVFISDNFCPFFWILIGPSHNDFHFFCPVGPQIQDFIIDLHRDGSRIGYDHSFTG